jgi:hypothetical protein
MAANSSAAEQGDEALTMHSMIKEIQGLKDKFKDEDVEEPSPFQVNPVRLKLSRGLRRQPVSQGEGAHPFL